MYSVLYEYPPAGRGTSRTTTLTMASNGRPQHAAEDRDHDRAAIIARAT